MAPWRDSRKGRLADLWDRVNGVLNNAKAPPREAPEGGCHHTRPEGLKSGDQASLRAEPPGGPSCGQKQGARMKRGGEQYRRLSRPEVSSPASAFHEPSYQEASGPEPRNVHRVSFLGSTDLDRLDLGWGRAGAENNQHKAG